MFEEQKKNGTYRDPWEIASEEEDESSDGESDNDDEEEGGSSRKRAKPAANAKIVDDDDDDNDQGGGDVDDFRAAFEKEMNQLKERNPEKKLVSNIFLKMPCVLFIKLHASIDPVEIVKRIFADAERTKIGKTRLVFFFFGFSPFHNHHFSRHCSRFTPVETICHADLDSLDKLKDSVLAKHFHQPNQAPTTVGGCC